MDQLRDGQVTQDVLATWILYGCMSVGLLIICWWTVIYLQPKSENSIAYTAISTSISPNASMHVPSKLVNVVCISALYLSLLCLFTAPLDVYLLQNTIAHIPTRLTNKNILHILYQVYFGFLVFHSFLGAPVVYNYARQSEMAHITLVFSAKERFSVALKRTGYFLLSLCIFVGILMVIFFYGVRDHAQEILLKMQAEYASDFELFLKMLVGILVVFGLYLWVFVTCRGLASTPISGLLMEDHSVLESRSKASTTFKALLEETDVEAEDAENIKQTILRRYVDARYMNAADQDRLVQLKDREDVLNKRRRILQENAKLLEEVNQSRVSMIFRLPIGLMLLTLSVLIVSSIFITTLDKFINSSFDRGFLLDHPYYPNPMDMLLIIASELFPIDYILFTVVFFYLFAASFLQLQQNGIRFVFYRLDRLEPRATSASTITLASLVIIYIIMVGLFSLLTLAPQYATFGHQVYVDNITGNVHQCTLTEAAKQHGSASPHCQLTQLAIFYNSMVLELPIMGLLFNSGQFIFCFVFLPFISHVYFKCKALPDPDPKRERLLGDYDV